MGTRKPIKLKGLVIPFNVENTNARIYTKDSFSEECIQDIEEKLKKDILLGEINPSNDSEISLVNVSHRVTDVEIKDDGLHAEIEILEGTPQGQIAKHLINSIELGGELPFSIASRSQGTINKDKTVNIDKILSFDIISKENSAFDQSFIKLIKNNEDEED